MTDAEQDALVKARRLVEEWWGQNHLESLVRNVFGDHSSLPETVMTDLVRRLVPVFEKADGQRGGVPLYLKDSEVCPKCKRPMLQLGPDGALYDADCGVREARGDAERAEAERDEGRRHNCAMEDMLTGARANARHECERADRAEHESFELENQVESLRWWLGDWKAKAERAEATVARLNAAVQGIREYVNEYGCPYCGDCGNIAHDRDDCPIRAALAATEEKP